MHPISLLFIPASFALLTGCNTLPSTGNSTALKNTASEMPVVTAPGKETTKAERKNNPQEEKLVLAQPKAINLTPLSTYTDEWTKNAPNGASFSDAYTRVVIFSDLLADGKVPAADGQSDTAPIQTLPYEPRIWLTRALIGKEFSLNLTAKITIGAFETTVPLVTIGHQSNSEGEQWNRAIHHSTSSFPLFLVKADGGASIPTIKLSVNGTKSYASRGAAAAVQVALGVARATSQPASVITRLTEQKTKDGARAIDDAISKLFASGITEEHWTDRDLKLWSIGNNSQPRGVTVEFSIPKDEQDWNSHYSPIGKWTITFDYPRPSIFSDWRVCDTAKLPRCSETPQAAKMNVLSEVDASEVLNYVLVSGNNGLGTIRAFISQQDWYVSAQTALTNAATADATASSLCRRIANEITGLGLNGFDARIVAWAIATGMPLPVGVSSFPEVSECKKPKNDRATPTK